MNLSFPPCRSWSPATSCRVCLAGTVLTLLLTGCASPEKDGSYFANLLKKSKPTHSAHYQEAPIVDEADTEIHDPLELKLSFAKWMEELKNYPEAQENYNFVLKERPQDVDAILGLARIDQATNRIDAAEAGFKKALAQSPDSAAAKNALGQLYVSQERFDEALPLLSDAILAKPNNKPFRFHLAAALARSGDVDAAYPHFKQVVGDAAAHYNLGMILKSQGQYRQAERQFLQALNKDPELEKAKLAVAEVRQLSPATGAYAARPAGAPQIQPTETSFARSAYARQTQPASAPQIQPVSVSPAPTTVATPYQPVSHQQAGTLTPRQQEQLRNQRILQR